MWLNKMIKIFKIKNKGSFSINIFPNFYSTFFSDKLRGNNLLVYKYVISCALLSKTEWNISIDENFFLTNKG